jgi:hypothetical protein
MFGHDEMVLFMQDNLIALSNLMLCFCRPKVGFFVEIFGFMNLFGNFIPHIIVVAKHLPVIGKILELPGIKQVFKILLPLHVCLVFAFETKYSCCTFLLSNPYPHPAGCRLAATKDYVIQ